MTTIEGLSANSQPVQKAWIEADVPQCGYCQSGQIMTAAALLAKNSQPTDSDIDEAMRGNMCRCGTYQSIRQAVHLAAVTAQAKGGADSERHDQRVNRREFLQAGAAVGGGLLIGFQLPVRGRASAAAALKLNAFVAVGAGRQRHPR